MIRNWYWWLVGGGIAAWALTARAQKAIEDRLVVLITMKPGYTVTEPVMNEIARVVATAGTACPGLPPIGDILELSSGATEGGGTSATQTVRAVYKATYTHDRTGPIKESVLACLLGHVRASNGNVAAVAAERPAAA